MSGPSEQDYEHLAQIGDGPPEPEPVQQDTDDEGGMDGLGYDPETGRYDDEPEEPEPEPPEPPVVQDEARVRAKISGIESLLRQERFRLDEYLALSDCPRSWIATTQAAVTALEADLASAQRRLPVAPQPRGRRVKHSDARRGQFTGLYNSWRNMIQRCTNPRATEYARYGALGVGFDPRWWDYAAFKADVGGTWRSGLSLDRIDNALGYSKDNCRWATKYQQTHNRGVKEPRTV